MAELVVRGGDWSALTRNVDRPRHAAIEAAAALRGRRATLPPALVIRAILTWLPALVPLDLRTYARIHFTRHARQTHDMLRAWAGVAGPGGQAAALRELADELALALEQSTHG
ncbi:hypothetical protein [Nonomuraea sp. JJY05]|uniref:hypothetical protein n=1 Tax=Nonomuraea sp. JJY05 TaxID=3350255 RepID=UPI00373FB9F0